MGAGVVVSLYLDTAKDAFNLLLSIGAGTGLIYLLRWFWWRINAWSEVSAMFSSFAVSLAFFIAGKLGHPVASHDDSAGDGWNDHRRLADRDVRHAAGCRRVADGILRQSPAGRAGLDGHPPGVRAAAVARFAGAVVAGLGAWAGGRLRRPLFGRTVRLRTAGGRLHLGGGKPRQHRRLSFSRAESLGYPQSRGCRHTRKTGLNSVPRRSFSTDCTR